MAQKDRLAMSGGANACLLSLLSFLLPDAVHAIIEFHVDKVALQCRGRWELRTI